MHLLQPIHSELSTVIPPSKLHWIIFSGQTSAHFPQRVQRESIIPISYLKLCDSGVEHHSHLKGHPLKNTTVLNPKPSLLDDRSMRRTLPTTDILLTTFSGLSNACNSGSRDNVILYVFVKFYKEGGVTGDPNKKPFMILWMLLRVN